MHLSSVMGLSKGMGKPRVIVFTQPDCLPCEAVKLFLADRGVEFEERNVLDGFRVVRELRQRYNSRSTPTVVIGDQVLIGFDPERLDQLLRKPVQSAPKAAKSSQLQKAE